MAVFKATDKKSDSAGKFKATEKRSYDSALVYDWDTRNKEARDILEQYRIKVNNGGYLSADDLATYKKALDSYEETSNGLRSIAKVFGSGNSMTDVTTWGSTMSKMRKNYQTMSEYYSKWETEDAYKAAIAQAEKEERLMKELLGDYDPVKNKQDAQTAWGEYQQMQERIAQNKAQSEANKSGWDKIGEWLGFTPQGAFDVDMNQIAEGYIQQDINSQKPDDRWTEDQQLAFAYLWNQDRTKAQQYAIAINNRLDAKQEQEQLQKIQDWATDNFGAGVVSTVGAVLSSQFGLADYLGDIIQQGAVGHIDEYDGNVSLFEYSQAVTGGMSQHLNDVGGTLNENIPVIGGKGLGDVYGLGTSIAQSALSAYTGGQAQTLITFFGSAAAGGVDDAISRGANGNQALLYGTSVGAAEALSEMIGIDNLLKIGSSAGKQLVLNLVKQAGAEGLEESVSNFLGNVADQAFMGDKSNFYLRVEEYRNAGMGEEEAKSKAWKEMWGDLAYDMLGGFASGGVHAGPHIAYQNAMQNSYAKNTYGGFQQELVGEALEIDPDNAYAQKMQGRLDRGKNLSGGQLNRLVQQNTTAITAQDMQSIQTAAETRLTELGETGDVATVAAALTKQAAGEKLSRAEQQAISNSKYGQRVANELNPENIRSGEYSSAWAEQIDTNRINAQEYSRLVEDAQLPQKATEATGGKAVNEVQNAAQVVQPGAVEAPMETVPANDQQMTGKLTGKESLQVSEESQVAEETAEKPVTLESASQKYGAQAKAMIHTYTAGQDVAKFDSAYRLAYNWGQAGVSPSYVNKLMNENAELSKNDAITAKVLRYLTKEQVELAYETGKAAANANAVTKEAENKAAANGKTVRREGVVRVDGITVKNLNELRATLNDTQKQAYKFLSDVTRATGIDIVLYRSTIGADGKFRDAKGKIAPQGYYRGTKEPGTIYIDLNAGLQNVDDVNKLHRYAMLRTFAHEFTHFIEKWNPVQYNEFRKVVFEAQESRGMNVHERIIDKQNNGMTYDEASREVVAEAMTDILPDSNFVQELASKHRNIFQWLRDKLKEFVENLKAYYRTIGGSYYEGATALKEQVGDTVKYLDSIVQLFDKAAVQAVEIYQLTVAGDEVVVSETESVAENATVEEESVEEVTQIPFDKKTNSYFNRASRVVIVDIDGQKFVSDGKLMVSASDAGVQYAKQAFDANDMDINIGMRKIISRASTLITESPTEALAPGSAVYIFGTGKSALYFDKRLLSVIDGGLLYHNNGEKGTPIIKSVNEDGSVKGYLLGMRIPDASKLRDEKPSKLKSFSKKMQALIDAQTVTKPADTVTKAPDTVTETSKSVTKQATNTPSEKLAAALLENYITEENINRGGKALTSKELYALADEAFGGTQAAGAYNRKDAYDAMELAVNKFLLQQAAKAYRTFNGSAQSAVAAVEFMQDMLELLPTQNVRTQEMEDFQQFSTPPNIAYLAAWAAKISNKDMVLEPSAGIGGLAVFAKAWGAEVAVNELSKRRLEVLRAMGFDHLFNENAEQIDNILPDNISPSVVIMNPPFSSTAGRTANNKTSNAEKHIDQALARLRDGGRLVAVLGKSMNNQDYYRYWDKLRKSFNIRANLSIDGSNYKKYGTTWGVQIVVIDKTGPQTGETVTGRFTDLTEVPKVLEGIRNDRSTEIKPGTAVTGSESTPVSAGAVKGQNPVSDTAGVENNRPAGNSGSRNRVDTGRTGDNSLPGIGEQSAGVQDADAAGSRGVRGTAVQSEEANEASAKGSTPAAAEQDGGIEPADSQVAGNVSGESETERGQSGTESARSAEVETSDDGVYATFVAPDIPLKGGEKHPAVLVESAAMAAVSMPKATYKPSLPENVIKNNLSDAQLVAVTYAGQAHEQKLPDGRRKGFFVGDGTGVGKGRQIAGIILDNFMQGRTKAVWISKNNDLYGDAIRDWTATTGRSKEEVVSHSRIKPKDRISLQEGILYSTYDTIKSEKGGSRLDQIVDWVGKDFDGVIAFDEAHNMGNLFGKKGKFGKSKGSEKARAGVELQRRLPNARIVYVSATAATEVDNLAYAERIGLWGQGTAFTTAQDFISKIGASGLAAMELVIRDMKAMGTYVARSISYNGVNYDTVEHGLDPMQTEIYNTMSRAWQNTMANVQSALETTGGQYNSTERQKALGNFYSAMQRFYNQVLTSMSMPSVIADMRKELAAGHSCVLQIVNTNEAQQNKQLAEAKANGESLDNLDMTPREALVGYLANSFPTQMFEEYTDEDGNLRSRPVMDSAGNPVQNREAIRQRDALLAEVNQMSIPDGPLEMLFDAFGPDAVAENTGRSRRVVPRKQSDGTISRVEERRTLNHRTADVQAFQDGKKRILVFSDAGGTGKSYHADRTEKNQQLRIHYVLQPGWVASNAVQGFGRTHRSNEASAPIYKLVTTNIKGQKRFTSTIARRLDQLGALTKGQRDTGSGMFGAKDNLETDLAKDSLREFYKRLGKNQIEGVDGMKTLDRLGLKQKFTDEYGAFKLNDNLARDIGTFLNRILALEVDEQNVVFDAFISIYEMELEAAIQAGTLDTGMENVKADRIEVVDDKVIRQDKNTGASTHYIQAKTYTKPKVVTTVAEMQQRRTGFEGIYRTETGAVKAVFRIADKSTEWGAIQKQYRLVGPNQGAKTNVWGEATLKEKAQPIDKADWQKEWDAEVARVPQYNEDTMHMLTGALLPIWNSLPQEGNTKVKRLIAHDGNTYLGRVIDKDLIDGVLKGFDIGRTMEVFTAKQVMGKALDNGTRFYLTNDRVQIFRSRVSGEWRLEVAQPYNSWYLTRRYPGIMQERISYRDRYFIPVGEKGIPILEKLLADNPVRNTMDDAEQYQSRDYLMEDESNDQRGIQTGADRASGVDQPVQGEIRGTTADRPGDRTDDRRLRKAKAWGDLAAKRRLGIVKTVENHINSSNNYDEIRLVLAATIGKPVTEMNLRDKQAAIEMLTQELYESITDLNNSRPLVENRWSLLGNIRPIIEAIYGENVQFQQRTNTLTDRDVLMLAYSEVETGNWSSDEKVALGILGKRLSKLEALQAERTELGILYREQQFGPNVDRKAAEETLNRMRVLDGQIQRASADVLDIENKEVLRRVLKKARGVIEQQDRQHFQEIMRRKLDRMHNSAAIKKYRDRLRGDVDELTDWVLHPDNKNVVKHIPDALKNTVIPFLSSINFMSKRSLGGGDPTVADKAFLEQLKKLRNAIRPDSSDPDKLYADYTDLPPDFMDRLNTFVETAKDIAENNQGEFIINKMTAAELQELSKIIRTLKKYIMQMNRFHVNAMFQHVYEAGDNSIDFLGQMKRDTFTRGISNFIRWQTMRAAYAFERFGKGGEAIYDGLRRGQATLAFNTKKIEAFAKKAYSVQEVKAWEKEVKTIRLGPGKTITMHVSQIMSLYELNKREQARGHIYGEGFRPSTTKKVSEDGHRLTPGELNLILRELTPRQKEVADKLQQFMQQQGGEWGNHVTVARFGEKQFGEENYFPINSDGRFLSAEAGEKPGATSLYALLNMGFTKQTQENAKNQIVVYSIFDVFANHMASMAQYNALALPLVDALKWFNYQQKSEPDENGYRTILGSVRDQMARVYGSPVEKAGTSGKNGFAEVFVINILKAFNGTAAQGTPYDTGLLKALHRYNLAQVSYNLRVVLQQPLAITRAAMLLDYASIIKGMKLSPSAIQKNIQEMQSHSGIAAWKSLGFYDVNVSRGLTELIKHDGSWVENVQNKGMWLAEKADTLTWAAIWSASKEEVIRKQHLTPKSEGFYEAVTKLFEDVIYKTQVVDSVLTKNEFMRDKGFGARSLGSFMSEATVDANMLVNVFDKLHMDMQRGMSLQQAWKQNRHIIGRTLYVYAIGQVLLAVVQSIGDAWRDDDDDYQEFYEKWWEAFWGLDGNLLNNLNPLNKLPLFSQFNEFVRGILAAGGFDIYSQMSNFVWADLAEQMEKGVEILVDNISGKDTNYEYYGGIYKLLQAVSGITGLPMASATREIVTAWNNIVGAMAPSLKVKTYELSDKSQIKYAYLDGYLTEEEAIQQLIEQGLVDTEDDAYWTIRGWESGDGVSKYADIYDAMLDGRDITAEVEEFTSHGYTEKEVLSQVKNQIGKWYKEGDITKKQAISMLMKYLKMNSVAAEAAITKWDRQSETSNSK